VALRLSPQVLGPGRTPVIVASPPEPSCWRVEDDASRIDVTSEIGVRTSRQVVDSVHFGVARPDPALSSDLIEATRRPGFGYKLFQSLCAEKHTSPDPIPREPALEAEAVTSL
jgi:hypothetical protein